MKREDFVAAIRAMPQPAAPVINVAAPSFDAVTLNATELRAILPEQKAPVVNVAAPVVNVPAPVVNVEAPVVNVPEAQKRRTRTVVQKHDAKGRIKEFIQEEI